MVYNYCVVIAPHTEGLNGWMFRNREISQRDWEAIFTLGEIRADECDPDKPLNRFVSFCRTEEDARAHCQYMAKLHPDREVYMCKVEGLAISKPAAPTFISITEKGALPR